ncbi:MAG: zinc ribbon domain-containing protein [Oscillospiraceae bacterium]|nr:zinc ribbon domain-containing protein [Oscillospiraceae bacterium]
MHDGKFSSEATMDEMIEHILKFVEILVKEARTYMTPAQTRSRMKESFPELNICKKKVDVA